MIKTSALQLVTPHRRVVPRRNDLRLPRRRFLSLAGAAVLPSAGCIAWAQAYPTRPIRFDLLGDVGDVLGIRSGKDKRVSAVRLNNRHGGNYGGGTRLR